MHNLSTELSLRYLHDILGLHDWHENTDISASEIMHIDFC